MLVVVDNSIKMQESSISSWQVSLQAWRIWMKVGMKNHGQGRFIHYYKENYLQQFETVTSYDF
jgi:hypothetical protein